MKVAHVTLTDLEGRRFNGLDLARRLVASGDEATVHVFHKRSGDPLVRRVGGRVLDTAARIARRIEFLLSIQNILSPLSIAMYLNKEIRRADVIHLQMVQSGYFGILALLLLARGKTVFWTLHDPWALTGHCVHPVLNGCERWKKGCGACPNLKALFPVALDATRISRRIKEWIYRRCRPDIIVASGFMERMARDSGVFTNSAIHRVPFGVDTVSYRPGDRFAVRERLGIPREAFVLLARASRSEFKGYPELDAMLGRAAWRNAVLLTVDGKNLFDHRKDRYLVMDQGWVLDDERMADLYRASDVFVMTSRAESFGMMAVEAMACGTPVVAFRNTALAELLDDGRTGVLVEDGDSAALLDGINRIKEDARYRAELIDAALLRVKAEYDFEAHFRAIREAYASAIARRANA